MPARITPPSLNDNGGSGTIVLSIFSCKSRNSSIESCKDFNRSCCESASMQSARQEVCRAMRRAPTRREAIGGFKRYTAQQTFEIEDAVQCAPQFFAGYCVFYLSLDRIQSGIYFRQLD